MHLQPAEKDKKSRFDRGRLQFFPNGKFTSLLPHVYLSTRGVPDNIVDFSGEVKGIFLAQGRVRWTIGPLERIAVGERLREDGGQEAGKECQEEE